MTTLAIGELYGLLKRKFILFLFFTVFLTSLSFYTPVDADVKAFPFLPGEKLTFRVRWAFITAGEAILEVRPIETVNGIRAYHFVLTARTNPVVDLIYKVRDKIEGYTDDKMTHSVLYKETKEGKAKKKVVVNFDWKKREAQRFTNDKMGTPIPLMPGAFDLLSIYYAFRTQDLKVGMKISAPVTDGEKCVMGKGKVIRRDRMKVPSGTYDSFLVEPDLEHIGGVFKRSKDAKIQIWVTSDHRKIPVMLKSKVAVGSFVAELVSMKNITK
jgi:hypothetical protein